MELRVEKRFEVLSQITRAQHFAWRRAIVELAPGLDPTAVVERMWEISGVDTARAYVRRLRPGPDLAADFARSIVWSSQCMGEDAHVETPADEPGVAYVRHDACPWMDWHARAGCLAEDRPGCDAWFQSAVDEVNRTLGTQLSVVTLSALPDGAPCCRRRVSGSG